MRSKEGFNMSKKNIGTIGHINQGETSLSEAINVNFGEREECIVCEGRFLSKEKIHRDFDNKTYCEYCYKEKYKDLI